MVGEVETALCACVCFWEVVDWTIVDFNKDIGS